MSITQPYQGLRRYLRKIAWSLRKRLYPNRSIIIPFDHDLRLCVRPVDRLGKRVRLNGYSDPELATLLDAYLAPGMTYFDVGAHFGQFVLMAGKRVAEHGAVHGFEPTRGTFSQLQTSISCNNMPWIKINHNAVADAPGQLELNVCATGKGEFNSIGTPMRTAQDIDHVETVAAITLDDYCRENNISHIDLMKIDVEGAELAVLHGGKITFSADNGPDVVCEFNEVTARNMGYTTAVLYNQFVEYGYQLFRYNNASGQLDNEPPDQVYNDTVNIIASKNPSVIQKRLQPA